MKTLRSKKEPKGKKSRLRDHFMMINFTTKTNNSIAL